MKILLKNNLSGQLSLDLFINKQTPRVRATIPIGGTIDIGQYITVEELANSQQLQEMVADGDISITLQADAHEILSLTSAAQLWALQLVAATAVIPMGIVAKSGTVVTVAAAAIDIGAVGESLSIDILKNTLTILTAPIVIDDTSVARTTVAGVLDSTNVQVVPGDFIEASLTYVAGGGPTPIANTIVGVEIVPA